MAAEPGPRGLLLKVGGAVGAAAVAVAEAVRQAFSASEGLLFGALRLLFSHLADSPAALRALWLAYGAVSERLMPYRLAAGWTLLGATATLVGAAVLPPLAAGLWRPRVRVFVSFHRSREADAQSLQAAMAAAGIEVLRMPFQPGASHQEVVATPIDGILRSHLVVCLPGPHSSFVDHEVYAATAADKPIAFVVDSDGGRLPDSADKRYPVFRLEALREAGHAPLVQFLRHVAGDARSTLAVVAEALRHPAMNVSLVWLLMLLGLGAALVLGLALWPLWTAPAPTLHRLTVHGVTVAVAAPNATANATATATVAAAVLLALLVGLALLALAYAGLVLARLAAQFRARRRMRRASSAAMFRRADWAGLLPGLAPGEPIYEALFDSAPLAHHEAMAGVAPPPAPRQRRVRSRSA